MLKNKSLHFITIECCSINTNLTYNINTDHCTISTSHQYPKRYYEDHRDEKKQYRDDHRAELNIYQKQYRENTRNPNSTKMGSLEHSIMISCQHQGINVDEFDGFLTDQRYCNLWTEKFRESIRKQFHYICYICGNPQEDRKLSVHHVNYDKSCLCQKTCEFVPLCGCCHSKTNYNRQSWENLIMGYLYPERYFMIEI